MNPPKHLSKESKAWWRQVCDDFELESHHHKLLQAACEAWDRVLEARLQVAKDGAYIRDRFNQLREHPGLKVEKDNRIVFARLLRELCLDIEPPKETRPPRQYRG